MREVLLGDLAYVQLGTVLQIMENEQLSGWVQTRAGTVVVRGGMIVDIDADGLPIPDAMMKLLDQDQGGFIVEAGSPPKQEILGTVPALLMQAARLKDDWQRNRGLVLEVQGRLEGKLATAERWFDGRRSLDEVTAAAGLYISEVVDLVQDCLDQGQLVPRATARSQDNQDTATERPLVHATTQGD